MATEAAAVGTLVVETRIKGSAEAVWHALTSDIHRWWPASFYTGGSEGRRRFVLEARPGGRMYEDWSGESGLLWATVNTVVPGKRLDAFGISFPLWGGPNLWTASWELTEKGRVTKLRFTEATVGRVSAASLADKNKGWKYLFDGALRSYVEGRPAPSWKGPTGSIDS